MPFQKSLLTLFVSLCLLPLSAQIKGVTETGEEVILFEDGSWRYANEEEAIAKEIPTNPEKFEKPEEASFLLKSKKLEVGIWLNPKEWSFKQATDNEEAEYELQLKGEDLYGLILTEKVEIPLENLKNIALQNGRAVAPDLRVVKEEYRNVNGLKVLHLQLNGTTQGIKFTYYGYYYSGPNGTVQFITYTGQNLLEQFLPQCEELLNGLSLVE